jgi:mannose-6-phosphate isomerase-like protein (cupin superfamily)
MALKTKIVAKAWGSEHWIENNEKYCLKLLIINPGWSGSLHYHKRKDETFYVVSGSCFLEHADQTLHLALGDGMRIMPYTQHRFFVPTGYAVCRIVEASTTHSDSDTFRIHPAFKLAC